MNGFIWYIYKNTHNSPIISLPSTSLQSKCQTSIDCEEFFELGLIEKGEDIADYYLRNHQLKEKKIDPEWNWDEYNTLFK